MSRFSPTSVLSVIGIAILVAGAIWYGMSQGSVGSTSLISTQSIGNSPDERELVETLLALRAVTLDGTVFNEPAFLSLRDFGTQIVPEPAGRPNPFAPLTGTVSQTAGANASTQTRTPTSTASTPPSRTTRGPQR